MSRRIKQKIGMWAEGAYVDLWTVPHFLFGVLLGFTPFFVDFPLAWLFAIAIAVVVLWEVYEYVRNIAETFSNRIVDVLIAIVGFGITVFTYPLVSPQVGNIAGVVILVLWGLINFSGWVVYLRRRWRR